MKQKIYQFIYKNILGWKMDVTVEIFDKCVICVAPHTSNFDLFLGKLFYGALGEKDSHFMMKKEWFRFPFGPFFRRVGGIPVHRGVKTSLVDQMAEAFNAKDKFHLAITPEATRKTNPEWKLGFYYIALGAKVPIILAAIDYEKKCIFANKVIYPSGDVVKDMREVKLYFKDFKGKHPERFDLGDLDIKLKERK